MTKLLDFDIAAVNWKDIVNAVLPINDECRINFNKNGIEIKQVDPANVSMVLIDLPKKCFKSYKVPEPVQVGFDFYMMADTNLGNFAEKKLSKMFKDGNPIIVPIEQIELNKEHIKELTGAEKVASEMRSDRNE